MILKALYDYYNRAADLAPMGMEYKEIGFLIVLDWDGNFIRLEDRRIDNKVCSKFLVSKQVGRTSGVKPNLLWDNSSYVLGYSDKEVKGNKLQLCYQSFKDKIGEAHQILPDNRELNATYRFYQQDYNELIAAVKADQLWPVVEKNLTKNFSFLIDGEYHLVAENREIINAFAKPDNNEDGKIYDQAICLITGIKSTPITISTATSISGSQATAKLVAFQVNSGYDSYGKSQGNNAPISEEANFAFTTALKQLLERDSKNKFLLGNRTYLCWASSKSETSKQIENSMFSFLGNSFDNDSSESDDPNSKIYEVRDTFMKIYSGEYPSNSDDRFYILGLAPNSARIAVVYWQDTSIKDFARNLGAHFDDMEIIDSRSADKRKPYVGIHSMMSAVTLGGKSSEVQPNLPDAVIKSIIQHTPYPASLFNACIRRIRAEQSPSITRVAILKAYLNRITNNSNKKLTVMLDNDNTNQGYVCGRLFAVLEYIQYRANGQSSIRERYLNAVSATPAAVFPTLLNLSVHHSEKLSQGSQIYTEKLKSEVIQKIAADGFPSHLDLNDQGRFFVGYYHQRQDIFSPKSDSDESESNEQ
jgi:CRISPR-associated protein Csd1